MSSLFDKKGMLPEPLPRCIGTRRSELCPSRGQCLIPGSESPISLCDEGEDMDDGLVRAAHEHRLAQSRPVESVLGGERVELDLLGISSVVT